MTVFETGGVTSSGGFCVTVTQCINLVTPSG